VTLEADVSRARHYVPMIVAPLISEGYRKVHDIIVPMRTTIEMKPEHRAALLALARLGDKGFSSVLQEAIETYLIQRAGPRTAPPGTALRFRIRCLKKKRASCARSPASCARAGDDPRRYRRAHRLAIKTRGDLPRSERWVLLR
jgi:hypothetical protein